MEAQVLFNLKCIKSFCSETVPNNFIYCAKNLFDYNVRALSCNKCNSVRSTGAH